MHIALQKKGMEYFELLIKFISKNYIIGTQVLFSKNSFSQHILETLKINLQCKL